MAMKLIFETKILGTRTKIKRERKTRHRLSDAN